MPRAEKASVRGALLCIFRQIYPFYAGRCFSKKEMRAGRRVCSLITSFAEKCIYSPFPAGRHDDMVDSSTQALTYLLHSAGQAETGTAQETGFGGAALYDVYG